MESEEETGGDEIRSVPPVTETSGVRTSARTPGRVCGAVGTGCLQQGARHRDHAKTRRYSEISRVESGRPGKKFPTRAERGASARTVFDVRPFGPTCPSLERPSHGAPSQGLAQAPGRTHRRLRMTGREGSHAATRTRQLPTRGPFRDTVPRSSRQALRKFRELLKLGERGRRRAEVLPPRGRPPGARTSDAKPAQGCTEGILFARPRDASHGGLFRPDHHECYVERSVSEERRATLGAALGATSSEYTLFGTPLLVDATLRDPPARP